MELEHINGSIEDHTKELINWVFNDIKNNLDASLSVYKVSDEKSEAGIIRIFPDDPKMQFGPLCKEIYKIDRLARECEKDHILHVKEAIIPGESYCLCGFPSIQWPIQVGGELVGTVLCGQRLLKETLKESEKMFQDFLEKYSAIIPDKQLLEQRFHETPVVSRGDFNKLHDELKGTANLMAQLYFDRKRIDRQREQYERAVRRISHELKNNTQAAFGTTEELRYRLKRGDLDKSRAVGRDLKGILVHMVNMARNVVWSPEQNYLFTMSDMLEMVKECARFYQWFAASKGVTINVAFDGARASVICSKIHMEQVIANLLHNAIKFSTGSFVDICLDFIAENRIQLQFKNMGIGISENEYERIFDEPYRGTGAWQSDRLGIGLGLGIVKGIVEMHNGSVNVLSEPIDDDSSLIIFTVTLPCGKHAPKQIIAGNKHG
jgi:signal transduction histidine kinase